MFLLNFDCVVREKLSAEVTLEVRPKGPEGTSRQSTRQEQFLQEEHAGWKLATSRNCKQPFVARAASTCRRDEVPGLKSFAFILSAMVSHWRF